MDNANFCKKSSKLLSNVLRYITFLKEKWEHNVTFERAMLDVLVYVHIPTPRIPRKAGERLMQLLHCHVNFQTAGGVTSPSTTVSPANPKVYFYQIRGYRSTSTKSEREGWLSLITRVHN